MMNNEIMISLLVLAMIQVLLKNGLYDRDFLLSHTNSSYLIQVDEGDEN